MKTLEKIDAIFDGLGEIISFFFHEVFPLIFCAGILYMAFKSLVFYITDIGWKGVFVWLVHWGLGPVIIGFAIKKDLPLLGVPGVIILLSALASGDNE